MRWIEIKSDKKFTVLVQPYSLQYILTYANDSEQRPLIPKSEFDKFTENLEAYLKIWGYHDD